MMGCVSEEIEGYENKLELELFKEYRDVIGLFKFVVETCATTSTSRRARSAAMSFSSSRSLTRGCGTSTARRASCVRCGSSPIRT